MKRSNDFVIGAVVIASVIAIVAFTLWLSQAHLGEKRREVVARFRDVGNAKVGNSVVIRGVEAGRIQAIELAANGWVDVRMSLDPNVTLPRDPIVILNESSMFGEWEATIMERDAAPTNQDVQQQLADAAGAGSGAIPGARLPDIAQLTAVAGHIAGDVSRVAERFQVAFDDRAASEMRQSIRNFSDLSTELARTVRVQSKNLDQLSAEVRSTMASINSTADALQHTAVRVDSSTSRGEVHEIVTNIGAASADIRATSRDLRETSRSLARTQAELESVLTRTDSVMTKIDRGQGSLGLMINDPSLYQNSAALVVQMRQLVAEMKEHPRKYFAVKIF